MRSPLKRRSWQDKPLPTPVSPTTVVQATTASARKVPSRASARAADAIDSATTTEPAAIALRLLAYCKANDWAGYDPYDALNSELFKALPMLDRRIPRLVMTQLLKRSPVNLRPLLLVPRTQNAKGHALFLQAMLKLSGLGLLEDPTLIPSFVDGLIAMRSPGTSYWCWGYSFPWQTRTIVVPRGYPNLVCTTFVANALLDAYDQCGDVRCLEMAKSAADYIVTELYWTDGRSVASLSYPLPKQPVRIHNANLLGAGLLCRVFSHSGEKRLLETALKVARYSAGCQRPDGSWMYGELATQQWIDNFHTGYNLAGLRAVDEYAATDEFAGVIERGYQFYRNHFIQDDGAPRYFHDRLYPIDVHCVAQSLITPLQFKHLDEGGPRLAQSVFDWAIRHMWDERCYFYYRVSPVHTTRTPYMRWGQAWMLVGLATFLQHKDHA
jgi:hypothetical protein